MEVDNPVQIPLDVPPDADLIWRYVNLEKLLSLIQSRQLFFASLGGFDDPYEGFYPRNVFLEPFQRIFEKLGTSKDTMALSREAGHGSSRINRKQYYVNCWHHNQHDSAAMWSLYSGRAGVAIKSTVGRLRTCLSTVPEPGPLSFGLVRYVDYATVTRKEVAGFPVTHLKRKSFEHEHELRAAVLRPLSEATAGLHVLVDLDSLIEEVIVEPKAADFVLGVVSDVVKKYGFAFKVRRSDLYTLT
jgi:hypothetical protein